MVRFLLPTFLMLGWLVSTSQAAELAVEKGDDTLHFKVGSKTVLSYRYGGKIWDGKGGEKPLAKPFFYPILAPNGTEVTRPWPIVRDDQPPTTDHIHQKSAWFCHGDVIPEGIEITAKSATRGVEGANYWDESANHGRMVCTAVGEPKKVSESHIVVPTRNEWQTSDGKKILDEVRNIHFVTRPEGHLIILDITLTPVVPVTFGDTKEGSMGVRVHDQMRTVQAGSGTVTSSSGVVVSHPAKDTLPVWGEIADWHDYSGKVNGTAVGVAIFADPKNPYPSAWHTRAYGLLAANPFGRAGSGFPSQKGKTNLVKLGKGEDLKMRFAIYAHDGDANSGKVKEAFEQFQKTK